LVKNQVIKIKAFEMRHFTCDEPTEDDMSKMRRMKKSRMNSERGIIKDVEGAYVKELRDTRVLVIIYT